MLSGLFSIITSHVAYPEPAQYVEMDRVASHGTRASLQWQHTSSAKFSGQLFSQV